MASEISLYRIRKKYRREVPGDARWSFPYNTILHIGWNDKLIAWLENHATSIRNKQLNKGVCYLLYPNEYKAFMDDCVKTVKQIQSVDNTKYDFGGIGVEWNIVDVLRQVAIDLFIGDIDTDWNVDDVWVEVSL